MPTAAKAETITQAQDWYEKSVGVVFSDYRGLKVKELQSLRSTLRKKGGEIHVMKNTLFRRAAGDATTSLPDTFHNGTTAFTFIFENEAEVAKALFEFARTNKALVVKGGLFGGKAVDTKQVEAISELPPKEVLIAQVIGAIAAPLTNLVGVIEALYADPIRVIGAVADKVAESSPITAAAAPAAVEPEAPAEPTPAEPAPVDPTPAQPETPPVTDPEPVPGTEPEPAAPTTEPEPTAPTTAPEPAPAAPSDPPAETPQA